MTDTDDSQRQLGTQNDSFSGSDTMNEAFFIFYAAAVLYCRGNSNYADIFIFHVCEREGVCMRIVDVVNPYNLKSHFAFAHDIT